MFKPCRLLALLLLIMALPPLAAAQEGAQEDAQEDALQSPEVFLGYALGSRFTPHHRVVDYVEHVAARSPRVQTERYGTTYEGRPLMVAFVASSENMDRLDAIRRANLQRAGLAEIAPADTPAAEAPAAEAPAAEAPAIVWLSYNVHGNEAVSTEAAMRTLYALADPQNARAQGWLEDVVVVIDPAVNPDGRDRYVQWYRQTRGAQPNAAPLAREHHEPWPGGRTNHYYFDLNRDWAWGVQRATRRRVALYNQWLPHVHVDFHEQSVDAPYYFAPAARPLHEDVTTWQREFQATIGRNNARYFDEEGWLYFTGEVFDLLYPGYGDTWPTFNGAIGMTYEQGGSGRAGLAIETATGDTLTLAERIAHHVTTGLSTIEATARNRARVLREFAAYYQEAPEGPYNAYVVRASGNPDRLAALADLLEFQGIRYGYAGAEQSARGFDYGTGEAADFTVAPGDLVVPADQPKATLAKVLFEPRTALADSLTYDITAWALPYAYGLNAFAAEGAVEIGTGAAPETRTAPESEGEAENAYAYLAEWKSLEDARLLAALLKAGVKARAAQEPFAMGGAEYARGTLVIARADNEAMGDRFGGAVRAVADSLGQPVTPVGTGLAASGPDFGSSNVVFIERPRVAVLSGPPLSSYAVGEVWHFFDRQLGYPATLLNTDELTAAALRTFDVLVLPDGSYGADLRERLEPLAAWVRGGGRVVALERAVGALAAMDGFGVERTSAPADSAAETPEDRLRTYAERERQAASGNVPGAIFRAQVDNTHPLGYGYPDTYHTLKVGEAAYAFLEDGWTVAALREGAHVSGFAGVEARKELQNTLVFGTQPMGSGAAVYLVDNPLFRGFWQGGKLFFANALFMVGAE